MADQTSDAAVGGEEARPIPVTRSSSFVEFFADSTSALAIEGGVHLAVLTNSPLITTQHISVDADGEPIGFAGIEIKSGYVENVRVRMHPMVAGQAAFSIYLTLIDDYRLPESAINQVFDALKERVRERDDREP